MQIKIEIEMCEILNFTQFLLEKVIENPSSKDLRTASL